jgi:hypothetical protein
MKRLTTVLAFLPLALVAGPLHPRETLAPAKTEPSPELQPVKLGLRPAAASVPALKYRLLPEVRDTTPGNAAVLYYRAFSPEWQNHRRDQKLMDRINAASESPLKDVPREELAWLTKTTMLLEVDRAARRQHCDWELVERVREEGVALLLPDMQGMRDFARLLTVRAKLELLDGRFGSAVYTAQTGLAMGRHVADAPILIQALVGVAICNVTLEELEEWVQQPGAPNLYWALTDLPRPLVDLHKPLQGERLFMDNVLPGFREMLDDPKKATPMTPAQVQAVVDKCRVIVGDKKPTTMEFAVQAVRGLPAAKQFLREQGFSDEQLDALPELQKVFLHELHRYDLLYDEACKAASLPYPEALANVRKVKDRRKAEDAGAELTRLSDIMLPATERVLGSAARLDRRVAALRCVEAIRLHAASHKGKLPARLADIVEVPIPGDPVTGREFEYRVEGDRAALNAPPPQGETATKYNAIRYELTVKP